MSDHQDDLVLIRPERADDVAAVGAVTQAAFSAAAYGHHGEADLIDHLRLNCVHVISLVAEHEGRVVGHVFLSPAVIKTAERVYDGMGLGPVSVLPEFQRRGIGARLIDAGLAIVRDGGDSFVCVLGAPAYYGRFGFQAAAPLGVYSEFGGADEGAFQILWLTDTPPKCEDALARYRPEFSEYLH